MGLSIHLGDDAYNELTDWFIETYVDGATVADSPDSVLSGRIVPGINLYGVVVYPSWYFVPRPTRSTYEEVQAVVSALQEFRESDWAPPLSLVLKALEQLDARRE